MPNFEDLLSRARKLAQNSKRKEEEDITSYREAAIQIVGAFSERFSENDRFDYETLFKLLRQYLRDKREQYFRSKTYLTLTRSGSYKLKQIAKAKSWKRLGAWGITVAGTKLHVVTYVSRMTGAGEREVVFDVSRV